MREIMFSFKELQPYLYLILSVVSFCHSYDFDGSSMSYAKYPGWVPCQNGTISFEFKTKMRDALLLYTDGGDSKDYYELKLSNGIVHLRFKINNEPHMLSAGQSLNDNEWHNVNIMREGRLTTLKVGPLSYTRQNNNYDPERAVDTFGESDENFVFIGGLPMEYNDRMSELALYKVILEPRLRGSIQNVFYSNCGMPLTSPTMIDSMGVIPNTDKCLQNNPCMHDGICVMRNTSVQCDCSMTAFVGEFCNIEKIKPTEQERLPVEAVFHGSQYMMYDLRRRGGPIFSSNDKISLYFKTTHASGLLFHTGDSKDYMTVSIKSGTIHVAVDLGTGAYTGIVDMNGYKLDDGQWHHLEVARRSRQITIGIDGTVRAEGTTSGDFSMLSSNVLYLAGSPNTHKLPGSMVRSNFRGCMKQVEYEADSINIDLLEKASEDHGLLTVVGDVKFGECEAVLESQPVTFNTPQSSIALPRWDVSKNVSTISFQFRTTESNGLVMYNSGSYGSSNLDFFAMEIIDGYFYLILDLGSGAIKEKVSRTRVDDGHPHSVHFHYSGKTGHMKIDAHQTDYITQGPDTVLDLKELLFIGGMDFQRFNAYRLPKELWSGILQYGYVGCFQDLKINKEKIDLMTVARKQFQRDIVSDCQTSEPQCVSQPCMHNGICIEGWNRYICDCRDTAYTGDNCEHVAATLGFNGAQYVLITLPEESTSEAEDISLRFRTIRDEGILFMTSSTHSADSIELYLERGSCKLTISRGSGSKNLSVGYGLNDDQWHTVFVKRRGQTMELRVDKNRPVTDIIPHVSTSLRITQIAVGSVGPMLSDNEPPSNLALTFDDDLSRDLDIQNDDSGSYPGFTGSLQQFIFNSNPYFDMINLENTDETIESTARFDNGESITRDPVTFESRDAYVILPSLRANKHFALYFKFKTSQNMGLILFNGKINHDFLSLEMYNGYLYYIYDMGGGSQRIRVNTPKPLNDNKWHDVSLLRPPKSDQQRIRVDDNPATIENMNDPSARRFDLNGPLYLGGVTRTLYNSLPSKIMSKHGYQGCIASLDINDYLMDILEAATLKEASVVAGCSSAEQTCHDRSCYNGGRCNQQWHSYVCDCDMTSFTGPTCKDESVSYRFGMAGGLIVYEDTETPGSNTRSDTLALGFKTIQDYGVLVRVDSSDSDDFIEMTIQGGHILVVYNMGMLDLPIGEPYHKVNDGKYHVVRFIRSGPNATLQLDNWNRGYKYPVGNSMSVFNKQARVWLGGRKDSSGKINNAFHGTMSGLVFNDIRILDLLKEGDERVSKQGDITLVSYSRDETSPPQDVEIEESIKDKDIQSTQGLKKRQKRSTLTENSTRKKSSMPESRPGSFYLNFKNMIDPGFDEELTREENAIAKHKLTKIPAMTVVSKNTAQNPYDHSKLVTDHPIGSADNNNKPDHVIGGQMDSIYSSGHGGMSLDNDETDVEHSGYSIFGSGENPLEDDEDVGIRLHKKEIRNSKLRDLIKKSQMHLLSPDTKTHFEDDKKHTNINLGTYQQAPFAMDRSHQQRNYIKDRGKKRGKFGKPWRIRQSRRTSQYNSRVHSRSHSKGSTPKQVATDDIIFSSSGDEDCFNHDDEEECNPSPTTSDDDIIKPHITITRRPTPSPEPNDSSKTPCVDNCTHDIVMGPNITTNKPHLVNPPTTDTNTTNKNPDPKETSDPIKDTGHMNIFLIVGIAAGVLVALIILVIALYKFRSRDEGSYRVDESQNFAKLEAKKQQTNGSSVNNVGNGKTGGKKKDVKEWYV